MPPRVKTSKEMIIDAGYRLTEKEGIDSVNCRAIATELGCSTQPVFSRFPNMDELKEAVFTAACDRLADEIASRKQKSPGETMVDITLSVLINLARENPNIYKLIYLSKFRSEYAFIIEKEKYHNYRELIKELVNQYEISEQDADVLFERIGFLTHGICTVLATTSMEYSDDQARGIIFDSIDDAVARIKK